MTPEDIATFRRTVYAAGKRLYRPMPWRDDPNPYYVFVSEIMLQQTQVPRVLQVFPLFVERFPDFATLSLADMAAILPIWTGMGYNRRARYLRDGAEMIMRRWAGTLPSDPRKLIELPGIGPNTSGSIAAFAFDQPVVFIETNIRRVFIHHFFQDAATVHDKDILTCVEQTLPPNQWRQWYWALMDYGTELARVVSNPNRKSRHYVKQSKFEGSTRQVRGALLKDLSQNGLIAAEQLPTYRGFPQERTETAVQALIEEGFLVRDEEGNILLAP